MPPTNDFVPFCNENTGTNLPSQSAYLANPNLPIGNQPGIASSSFNNKAIRQGSTMAAVLAQYIADVMSVDMLDNQNSADHAVPTALLAALKGGLLRLDPVQTILTSGTNHRVTVKFQVVNANATSGDVYTDGTSNFTVTSTISAGTLLTVTCTSGAFPATFSGTLTRSSGSGDATIAFYSYRKPLFMDVIAIGGGGGGGGCAGGSNAAAAAGGGSGAMCQLRIVGPSATYAYTIGAAGGGGSAGNNPGTSGGNTTFGGVLTANGGGGGGGSPAGATTVAKQADPAAASTASGGDINAKGNTGGPGITYGSGACVGGYGGASPLGGGVGQGAINGGAGAAGGNYGAGGGGAGASSGSAASAGGAGLVGAVIVWEYFQ